MASKTVCCREVSSKVRPRVSLVGDFIVWFGVDGYTAWYKFAVDAFDLLRPAFSCHFAYLFRVRIQTLNVCRRLWHGVVEKVAVHTSPRSVSIVGAISRLDHLHSSFAHAFRICKLFVTISRTVNFSKRLTKSQHGGSGWKLFRHASWRFETTKSSGAELEN